MFFLQQSVLIVLLIHRAGGSVVGRVNPSGARAAEPDLNRHVLLAPLSLPLVLRWGLASPRLSERAELWCLPTCVHGCPPFAWVLYSLCTVDLLFVDVSWRRVRPEFQIFCLEACACPCC